MPGSSDASSDCSLEEKYADIEGREGDGKTRSEEHWKQLRDVLQFARVQEDEDALTDMYVDLLGPRGVKDMDGTLLSLPKGHDEQGKLLPSWEYEGATAWSRPGQRFLSTPVQLKEKEVIKPEMHPTHDKYTVVTWYFLRSRVQVEEKEIADSGVKVFLNSILQILTCAVIWGLGSSELDGGRVEVVVASFAVGAVGIIAQVFGILGSLSENEEFLRKYWIAQLWLLSLVVTFLYTELHHIQDHDRSCNPSGSDYATNFKVDSSCARDEAVVTAALIMNAVQLLLSFFAVYHTTGMLDSINDKTSIEDNIHVFKYFQVYVSELSERMLCAGGTGGVE